MSEQKPRNPYHDVCWEVGLTWPEDRLIDSIRAGRILPHPINDPEFVAGMLTEDGGGTPESVQREREQWEEAWADLLNDLRQVFGDVLGNTRSPLSPALEAFAAFTDDLGRGFSEEALCSEMKLSPGQYDRYCRAVDIIRAVHEEVEAKVRGGQDHV